MKRTPKAPGIDGRWRPRSRGASHWALSLDGFFWKTGMTLAASVKTETEHPRS